MSDANEVVIEYRSRGARIALWTSVVVLAIMLVALGVYVYFALTPIGAPSRAADPTGLSWVRSIYGWGQELLSQPTDVEVGPDGTIWTTDPARARVIGFNPDGTLRAVIQTGEPASGEGLIMRPEGLGVDENGDVLIADFGNNKIIVFDAYSRFIREWSVPSPLDVAVGPDRIAVSTVFGIAFFDREGTYITKWGTRGREVGQFDIPHGIAVDEEGAVYVADSQNARVIAYNSLSELMWVAGSQRGRDESATAESGEAALEIPSGVVIDGAGRVVAVDPFNFGMFVFDAKTGALIAQHGDFGSDDGAFLYPTGIAYDAARDWFVVADTGNDRLQIVRIPDSGGGIIEDVRSRLTGPAWLCALPLAVGLLGIVYLWWRRRRAKRRLTAELSTETPASA